MHIEQTQQAIAGMGDLVVDVGGTAVSSGALLASSICLLVGTEI